LVEATYATVCLFKLSLSKAAGLPRNESGRSESGKRKRERERESTRRKQRWSPVRSGCRSVQIERSKSQFTDNRRNLARYRSRVNHVAVKIDSSKIFK